MQFSRIVEALELTDEQQEAMAGNWEKSVETFPGGLPGFLQPGEYRKNYEYTGLPAELLPLLDETAERIRNSEEMLWLAWHCYCCQYRYPDQRFGEWPRFENQLGSNSCLFYLLVALATVPLTIARYKQDGIPEEYAAALCSRINGFYQTYLKGNKHHGLNPTQLFWFRLYTDGKIFRIGRFEFMPKQVSEAELCFRVFKNRVNGKIAALQTTAQKYDASGWCIGDGEPAEWTKYTGQDIAVSEEYVEGEYIFPEGKIAGQRLRLPLGEWEQVLPASGATVLDMHIPEGGNMNPLVCKQSFTDALVFFARYFPELRITGFLCYSWIFYPFYEQALPQSNLADQMKNVYLVPCYSWAGQEGFYFIFGKGYTQGEDYPRDNSVRKVMLDEIERGGHLRSGAMFLLAEHTGLYGSQPYRGALKYLPLKN